MNLGTDLGGIIIYTYFLSTAICLFGYFIELSVKKVSWLGIFLRAIALLTPVVNTLIILIYVAEKTSDLPILIRKLIKRR